MRSTPSPEGAGADLLLGTLGKPTGRSLNAFVEDNNAKAVTRKINGRLNDFENRLGLYTRAALVCWATSSRRDAFWRDQLAYFEDIIEKADLTASQ